MAQVFGHLPRTAKERLLEIAAGLMDEAPDRYGAGELVERLEHRVAELLGKEATVFMPSGVMAQQAALRVHAEQSGNRLVALHPRSHLLESESNAFEVLHGLRGVALGAATQMSSAADVRALDEPVGTLLLELPDRNLGGTLRPWDDLCALLEAARERGMRIHLDGARLWECSPFYQRPYAEIARSFDTVYVSMYKVLNGLAGAVLAGPAEIITQARVWQIRHGGRLVTQFPMLASAWQGLDAYLPRIPLYVDRAARIAQVFREFKGVRVVPSSPPTNMMHVYLDGDRERLESALLGAAASTGLKLAGSLRPTPVDGWSMFEVHCSEGALLVDDALIRRCVTQVLECA